MSDFSMSHNHRKKATFILPFSYMQAVPAKQYRWLRHYSTAERGVERERDICTSPPATAGLNTRLICVSTQVILIQMFPFTEGQRLIQSFPLTSQRANIQEEAKEAQCGILKASFDVLNSLLFSRTGFCFLWMSAVLVDWKEEKDWSSIYFSYLRKF